MRDMRGKAVLLASAALLGLGCSSEPVDDDDDTGSGGQPTTEPADNPCSAALRQELALVDEVTSRSVTVLEASGDEQVLYVDATAGGPDGTEPWVYISLASGQAVALSDIDALGSTEWDLALRRFVLRTNSGDSGPGQGGALRVNLGWSSVDAETLGNRTPPSELWFDAECNLTVDSSTGDVITTFSGWSEYDLMTHLLTPADAVYLTLGGDGALYKVAILDYYSNPNGTHGSTPGRYQLRIAPLP
jgi:hypothetical protein